MGILTDLWKLFIEGKWREKIAAFAIAFGIGISTLIVCGMLVAVLALLS